MRLSGCRMSCDLPNRLRASLMTYSRHPERLCRERLSEEETHAGGSSADRDRTVEARVPDIGVESSDLGGHSSGFADAG